MKETFEYIDLISQTIDKTIKIKSVVVNLDNTIDLQVNKTLWLTVSNRPIVVDNVEYKIKSIINNALIKLEPNLTPVTATEFQAYDFYYFHGTLTEVNIELNQIADSFLKFPMLYLVEVLEEENNTNDVEVVQRRVNARLLFATETDYVNNDTDGLYSTGIYPVRNFVNEFIYACENSPYINDLPDTYRSIPLTRIARYDANGHVSKLVNSQLTGIELRIELPLTDCECCDVQPTTLALQGNENIFLTCGTLADCPVIETIGEVLADHEERIEALEQGGGGGGDFLPLAGGTMNQSANINLPFGGNSLNISPFGIDIINGSNYTTYSSNQMLISTDTENTYIGNKTININDLTTNKEKSINYGNEPSSNITINLPDFSGTLALLSDITSALIGYATEAWVNSQGFITNVITALGYTPENVANKATNLTSPDNTKYPTTQAVANGLALKLNIGAATHCKYFAYDNVTASVTGTTDETVMRNILIPAGSIGANGILQIFNHCFKTTSTTTGATVRMYLATVGTNLVGNTGTPTSATLIATNIIGTANNAYTPFNRSLVNKNSESLNEILLVTNNSPSNDTVSINTALSTLNIDTSVNLWLVLTFQLNNSANVGFYNNTQLYINKPE
jgi:hypothetical protein